MSRALFIVDDRPEAGRGHVVRCGALADELGARGWDTETHSWTETLTRQTQQEDVVIVDSYAAKPSYYGPIDEYHAPVVAITDLPGVFPVSLLVNGGAGANPDMYRDSGAREALAGPQYALLREPFRNTYRGKSGFSSSHDVYDLRTFDGHVHEETAAAIMAASRLVITAAGMRAMEAACVGAPMILFVESEDQESNALALQKCAAGIIAYTEEYAQKQVKQLLKDPDWLSRMSAAGRRLVDGKGCIRVADAIERLVA